MKVLIADNHELVRTGIRSALESEQDIQVVGEACDGAQAIDMAEALQPDIIIMDVRMPGVDGVAACRDIAVGVGHPKVLMLSVYDDDKDVFDAIEAGASGFMIKNVRARELVEALRTVAGGRSYFHPIIADKLSDKIKKMSKTNRDRIKFYESLTRREMEVLKRVGQGLRNSDIAAELFISEATVKTHVSSLLRKLEKRDRTQLAILVREKHLI